MVQGEGGHSSGQGTPMMPQLSPLQRSLLRPSGSLFLGRAVLVCAAADGPALSVPGGRAIMGVGVRQGLSMVLGFSN